MKQIIRLTESDLHKLVKESVQKILGEIADPSDFLDQEPGNASFGKYYDEDGYEYNPYEDDGEDYLGNAL